MDDGVELNGPLGRAQAGDAAAAEAVFRATYDELRYIAHVRLGSGRRNTLLDTTALVHEWFLRFARTHAIRDLRTAPLHALRRARDAHHHRGLRPGRTAARRGEGSPACPPRHRGDAGQGPEEVPSPSTARWRGLPRGMPGWRRWWSSGTSAVSPRPRRGRRWA